jgi:hypothetical protein
MARPYQQMYEMPQCLGKGQKCKTGKPPGGCHWRHFHEPEAPAFILRILGHWGIRSNTSSQIGGKFGRRTTISEQCGRQNVCIRRLITAALILQYVAGASGRGGAHAGTAYSNYNVLQSTRGSTVEITQFIILIS